MTVQELISELKQFDPETEVMTEYRDQTDWLYKTPLEPGDVFLGDGLCDSDDDGENWDENGFFVGKPKVIITFRDN